MNVWSTDPETGDNLHLGKIDGEVFRWAVDPAVVISKLKSSKLGVEGLHPSRKLYFPRWLDELAKYKQNYLSIGQVFR